MKQTDEDARDEDGTEDGGENGGDCDGENGGEMGRLLLLLFLTSLPKLLMIVGLSCWLTNMPRLAA